MIIHKNWWCLWKFRTLKSNKKRKILIVFDDIIADMEANIELRPIAITLRS